ncbi:hypothetical protein EDD85DRAFT_958112 [Armillaria nabsnona]|nr:hypothetical protein EDD85DRAFT_958112 [Armillaria nabsnona]
MHADFSRTEGPNFAPRRRARAFVQESRTSSLFPAATTCGLYRSGEEAHERYWGALYGAEEFLRRRRLRIQILRRDEYCQDVMVETKGRRAAARRMTTDALAMSIHPFLAQHPSVLRVCRPLLKPPAMSTSVSRNLFQLQDNESSSCEGQHRVQAGGGIEGDDDDRGDSDEDALLSPLLSVIGQLPRHKISPSNDVLRTREGCAEEVTMYLVPNPTSNINGKFSNQASSLPQRLLAGHYQTVQSHRLRTGSDNDKDGAEVAASTFCLSDVRVCPVPPCSPWRLEELNSAATFSGGGHSQSKWRVMNERRSHLLSLGLLHTMRRRLNGVRPWKRNNVFALYFSVAALLIFLALSPRPAHSLRADTLYHLIRQDSKVHNRARMTSIDSPT